MIPRVASISRFCTKSHHSWIWKSLNGSYPKYEAFEVDLQTSVVWRLNSGYFRRRIIIIIHVIVEAALWFKPPVCFSFNPPVCFHLFVSFPDVRAARLKYQKLIRRCILAFTLDCTVVQTLGVEEDVQHLLHSLPYSWFSSSWSPLKTSSFVSLRHIWSLAKKFKIYILNWYNNFFFKKNQNL